MHALPKYESARKTWVQIILKGRKDLKSEKDVPNDFFVSSDHFLDGRPMKSNPSPTLFLTLSANTVPTPKPRKSPRKRKSYLRNRKQKM